MRVCVDNIFTMLYCTHTEYIEVLSQLKTILRTLTILLRTTCPCLHLCNLAALQKVTEEFTVENTVEFEP